MAYDGTSMKIDASKKKQRKTAVSIHVEKIWLISSQWRRIKILCISLFLSARLEMITFW